MATADWTLRRSYPVIYFLAQRPLLRQGYVVLCVGLTLMTCAVTSMAQGNPPDPLKLIVGTKHAPPFVIKHDDGTWTGISLVLSSGATLRSNCI